MSNYYIWYVDLHPLNYYAFSISSEKYENAKKRPKKGLVNWKLLKSGLTKTQKNRSEAVF